MTNRIALCASEELQRNPELIGLDGELLDSQQWLLPYTCGTEARESLALRDDVTETWVFPCPDIDAINLAASLKADHPDMSVRLVTNETSGSLASRAHAASIDEVVDWRLFPKRYAEAKRAFSSEADNAPASPAPARGESAAAAPAETKQAAPPTRAVLVAPPPSGNAAATPGVSGQCFIMPVVSGSGGAGKSTVSTLGAHIAALMGYKTLLLDYDLQFGDADVLSSAESPLAIDEAIAQPALLEREIAKGASPMVLAAPARLEMSEAVVHELPQLLARLSQSFEVIVCNTGAAWAEQHAALLERSSTSLFLIDQRASSVRACKHALELCARCGIATSPFRFAINRCAKGAPLTSIDVSCALDGAPVIELKDGGMAVEEYLASGGADELIASGNELCASLRDAMAELLPHGSLAAAAPAEPADAKPQRRRGLHAGRKRGRRS